MNVKRNVQKELFCSVIIPTLNEEKYIPNLLNDLLKQTFVDFEIVVIDGYSNDQSIKIVHSFISKFKKRNIKLVVQSVKKRSVSYQRNYGAKNAKGTYLQFFDADVSIKPDHMYLLQKNIYRTHALFATTKLQADSQNIFDKLIVFAINTSINLLRWTSFAFVIGLNTITHRRTFAFLKGFDESIQFGEDHDLTMRAKKNNIRPAFLERPVVTMSMRRYRKNGRLRTVLTLVGTFLHEIIIGPVEKKSIQYPMGGNTNA